MILVHTGGFACFSPNHHSPSQNKKTVPPGGLPSGRAVKNQNSKLPPRDINIQGRKLARGRWMGRTPGKTRFETTIRGEQGTLILAGILSGYRPGLIPSLGGDWNGASPVLLHCFPHKIRVQRHHLTNHNHRRVPQLLRVGQVGQGLYPA